MIPTTFRFSKFEEFLKETFSVLRYAIATRREAMEYVKAEEILQQLKVLDEVFRTEPEILRLLAAPNLSKPERCSVLDSSFRGKLHPYILNFMKILTEKGYSRHFH